MKAKQLGRPSKFTPEVRQKILWALRLGNYRRPAAEYAGISERTLGDWLMRGRDAESGPYADFYAEVLEAERAAEVRALGVIQQAAKRDWKAAAWFLERKHPERFCTRAAVFLAKRLQIEGEVDWDAMGDDELEAELLRAVQGVAELLRAVQGVAKSIPREKLIAAIDGEESAIDVDRDVQRRALRLAE